MILSEDIQKSIDYVVEVGDQDPHPTDKWLAKAKQLEAENEKLRDAIEEALDYRGPECASILRYALKGDDDA